MQGPLERLLQDSATSHRYWKVSSCSRSCSFFFQKKKTELGIDFKEIYSKTHSVLHPTKEVDRQLMEGTGDLAGPLIFCLMLGGALLLVILIKAFFKKISLQRGLSFILVFECPLLKKDIF